MTERARKVLQLAQEEAQRFNHNYIGTEHLLLGLVRAGEGVAAKVLANLGVKLEDVRRSVEFIIGRGDRTVAGDIGLTPRAKKVIELSVDEARRLNHHYLGTEHLLLGLAREGEGIAAGVLESLGVSLDKVRSQVIYVLNQSGTYAAAPPSEPAEQAAAGRRRAQTRPPRPGPGSGLAGRLAKFTEQSRRVFQLAQEEAHRFGHPFIGAEHLLLGLVAERGSRAARVLAGLGVDLDRARAAVEKILAPDAHVGEAGLTADAKQVIERAVAERRRSPRRFVATEQLLLGLLATDRGEGVAILESLGVAPEAVRAALQRPPPSEA